MKKEAVKPPLVFLIVTNGLTQRNFKGIKKGGNMYDFFKLSAPAKYSEQLLNNPNFGFNTKRNNKGEPIPNEYGYITYKGKYFDFRIKIKIPPINPIENTEIEITGSFHKLFEGGSNYQNFYFFDFITAVNTLCNVLKIYPSELYIHVFEIGVNILPPIELMFLIEGLKSFSRQKFERDTFHRTGLLMAVDFSENRIKIYNKSMQYNQPEPILRFELKIKKMAYIKNKGVNITTLQDIISGDWNDYFGNLLLTQWDKVIICPQGMINPNLIPNPRTRENFINGLNPDYWTGLNSKAYKRQFARFKAMFKQFAPIDLYSVIHGLISDKWETLSKGQRVNYYPYIYSNNNPFTTNEPKQRFCVTCGRDISNQKKNSKFCSETIHGPEVKKCRNIQSNPRNNYKRKQDRIYSGPTLFPIYIHYGII